MAAFRTMVDDGDPSFRKSPFDVEEAIAQIEASGWPRADDYVRENVRVAITREEAANVLEGRA